MILRIKNLKAQTMLGVFEWEQTARRSVILNLTIQYDGDRAAESDRLEDAPDYAEMELVIVEYLERNRFHLIERLVAEVAGLIMQDERVSEVTVEADKPGALRFSDSVSVSETFRRGGVNADSPD